MADKKYSKVFVDGQVGNTLSVPASGDWTANVVFYDRFGERFDTTSTSCSASFEFYGSIGRAQNFEFEKDIILDVSFNSQGVLVVEGDLGEFSAGTKKYGYAKLKIENETIISPNFITVSSY